MSKTQWLSILESEEVQGWLNSIRKEDGLKVGQRYIENFDISYEQMAAAIDPILDEIKIYIEAGGDVETYLLEKAAESVELPKFLKSKGVIFPKDYSSFQILDRIETFAVPQNELEVTSISDIEALAEAEISFFFTNLYIIEQLEGPQENRGQPMCEKCGLHEVSYEGEDCDDCEEEHREVVIHGLAGLNVPEEYYFVTLPKLEISKKIKEWTKTNGTLDDLAEKAGITKDRLVYITSGEDYGVEDFLRVVHAMGLSLSLK